MADVSAVGLDIRRAGRAASWRVQEKLDFGDRVPDHCACRVVCML